MECEVCGSGDITVEICHTTHWRFCGGCGAVIEVTDYRDGITVRQS